MSLINQMLKDIDQRRGASPASPAANHDLRGVLKARVSQFTLWLGVSLFVALMVSAVVVFKGQRTPAPASAPAAVATPIAPPAPAPAPAVEPAPAPVAPTATVAAKLPEPTKAVVAQKAPASAELVAAPAMAPPGAVSRMITEDQRAQNMYRDAVALIQQGRLEDAQTLLQQGLKIAPQRTEFVMALAHVQLAMNDVDQAIKVLQDGLSTAASNAEYQGFLATLLQRVGRHEEAIEHYVIALRLKPDAANWLLGLGISLQSKRDDRSAAEAYQRAIELGLTPSLMQFAQDRLKQLSQ